MQTLVFTIASRLNMNEECKNINGRITHVHDKLASYDQRYRGESPRLVSRPTGISAISGHELPRVRAVYQMLEFLVSAKCCTNRFHTDRMIFQIYKISLKKNIFSAEIIHWKPELIYLMFLPKFNFVQIQKWCYNKRWGISKSRKCKT